MIDLGTLGGSFSRGNGINNLRQVTGSADTPAGQLHAFLYSNGKTIDLNNVIDPALGMTWNAASSIDDEGQVLANSSGASARAFLLTPVPEPATLGFFGAALIVSIQANRRSARCH